MPESDRAAYVKSEDVHPQLRHWSRGRVKEVAGVKPVLAMEFPCGSMKGAGAGLEHHGHGCGRRETVFSAVVRRQGAEFRDGVRGRRNAHVPRTAAIVVLAAVQQINVVARAPAVEAHVGVAANRDVEEAGDVVGGTGSQPGKNIKAAPVGRNLRELLVGDDITHVPRICLHADRGSFHRDGLRGRTYLHLEIDARTVADLKQDPFLLRDRKSTRLNSSHRCISYAVFCLKKKNNTIK